MRALMTILKALADENRVRALMALRNGELCACQIIELLGLAPSTVSKHMSILKQARLVESRKEGRWMYYRWPGDEATPEAAAAIEWLRHQCDSDRSIVSDRKALRAILRKDPEELCRGQRACCQGAASEGAREHA